MSDGTRASYGGYAEADFQLLKNVTVNGGLQANKIRKAGVTVVPRAGIIWNPVPKIAVKALYGQAFRAPYINELYIDHPGLWETPNLKPEHVASTDLEVGYVDAGLELVVKYFDNRQRDNIVEVLLSGETRPHYENAGVANMRGFEFSGKRYVSTSVYLTGSRFIRPATTGMGSTISPSAPASAPKAASVTGPTPPPSACSMSTRAMSPSACTKLNPPPGSYHLLALHATLNLNQVLTLKRTPQIAVILQIDNLLTSNAVPARAIRRPTRCRSTRVALLIWGSGSVSEWCRPEPRADCWCESSYPGRSFGSASAQAAACVMNGAPSKTTGGRNAASEGAGSPSGCHSRR